MADQKISQLPALTSAADIDVIPIVDISGNETKKIEVQNLIPTVPTSSTITVSGITFPGEYETGSDILVWFGGAVTAGECYAADPVTGWTATDATSVGYVSTGILGIAPVSGNAVDGMIIRGIVRLSVDPGGSVGDVVYLSTTPGQLTTTPVASPNNVSRVVGYKIMTNTVFFDPSKDWIEIS